MPRRNFVTILFVAVISFACYRVTDHNPYGRYFADIMHKIDRMYYKPVDREKLFDTAVKGMVDSLDIHSEFKDRDEAGKFLSDIDQRYAGVGIEIDDDAQAKQLIVTDTLVGSPAYLAPILAGDQILKVNGISVNDVGLKNISNRIRGQVGTKVRLTIQRAGEEKPIELALLRAEVNVNSVLGDTRNADDSWNFHLEGHPEIGYIRIGAEGFRASGGFGDRTAEELAAALATLDRHALKGLIVDLRFNGGGRLDVAIKVCSEFIPPGQLVVSLKGRGGVPEGEERSVGPGTYADVPMVVLVNPLSASASEIVAACLQDHHRAAIAGQRSYGKGTVQKVLPVEGNQSILKLTTATYWRPSNKNIHREPDAKESDDWGVMPDKGLAVALSKEETAKLVESRARRDVVHRALPAAAPAPVPYVDPQLQRAIDYLEKPPAAAAKS